MAMYQNMLVVIDPNQGRPTSIAASCLFTSTDWWQKLKPFLPIYDFSYEMTTLLSPDERTAMRQGRHQPAYSTGSTSRQNIISMLAFPLKLKWSGITVLSKPSFRK